MDGKKQALTLKQRVIGVLALQGAVLPHKSHIEAAGGTFMPVKTVEDFARADAFILPGGESTTMLKLIDTFGLEASLRRAFADKPVWGICAGAILMAKKVSNPAQTSFALIDMDITRNAYGRQLASTVIAVDGYPVSYIRAPVIERTGPDVRVLAARDGKPIWVQQGQYIATAFHPELTADYPSPFHKTFVDGIRPR